MIAGVSLVGARAEYARRVAAPLPCPAKLAQLQAKLRWQGRQVLLAGAVAAVARSRHARRPRTLNSDRCSLQALAARQENLPEVVKAVVQASNEAESKARIEGVLSLASGVPETGGKFDVFAMLEGFRMPSFESFESFERPESFDFKAFFDSAEAVASSTTQDLLRTGHLRTFFSEEQLQGLTSAAQDLSGLAEDLSLAATNLAAPWLASAEATPALCGAAVVFLLGLRRGPQPWLSNIAGDFNPEAIEAYWSRRPLRLLQKFALVAYRGGSFWLQLRLDQASNKENENMPQRAAEAKELVTDLGVSFIKIAQLWASRPDILPEPYIKEFEKLLEQVRPFGKDEAFITLRRNLPDMESMFDNMEAFEKPVASASVGQVYKASIRGQSVAVKVQRPDVREQVSLDVFIIRAVCKLGLLLPDERLRRQCQSSLDLISLTAPTWFEELDYEAEARNQQKFFDSVASCELIRDSIVVPEVVLSKPEVLVQEWLDGQKLSELKGDTETSGKVVNLLLNSYMVQFLETGYLHGDPHPGNFIWMPATGRLGILDYGLMTTIRPDKQVAFIEYLMHLQAKDYGKCLTDLINLEFIPAAVGDDPEARNVLVPALTSTLSTLYDEGGDMRKKQEIFTAQREEMKASGKLDVLRQQLQSISNKYGTFRLPAYFTLILRSFSTLEGLGLRMDKNFNIVQECFPYIARRLLTDDSDHIREALRSYLYMGRRRIAVKRIHDLSTGFGTFTNLMKTDRGQETSESRSQDFDFQGAGQTSIGSAGTSVKLDSAMQDITKVVFSPDGNFLQDILIDEGIAAVDALSRAGLLQLVKVLGPLALPFTLPLTLILGAGGLVEAQHLILAREDKEALLLLRRIAQLLQGSGEVGSTRRLRNPETLLQELLRLQPVAQGLLPSLTPGVSSFALRFSQQLARRVLLRLAADIEKTAGLSSKSRTR